MNSLLCHNIKEFHQVEWKKLHTKESILYESICLTFCWGWFISKAESDVENGEEWQKKNLHPLVHVPICQEPGTPAQSPHEYQGPKHLSPLLLPFQVQHQGTELQGKHLGLEPMTIWDTDCIGILDTLQCWLRGIFTLFPTTALSNNTTTNSM